MVLIFGLGAFVATLFGGLFTLRFKDKLHLVLGLSGGAVLGVALFDLLPEANELIGDRAIHLVGLLIAIGFVFFMIMDRILSIHPHACHDCENEKHSGSHGASALIVHSFLDGVIIGLAFKVSGAAGVIVASAVLAHNFSDGINTVSYLLKNDNAYDNVYKWLFLAAAAPFLGAISTYFFSIPDYYLGVILALFCGFFLYIGASDLLPESHHRHPKASTTLMTLFGMAIIFAVVQIVHA
jgi:ZIP family zinc transporter